MMIERTADLPAPPARIWTLLTEPAQVARWITELVSDEPTTPPPHGVGTTTRMKIREGARVVEYALTDLGGATRLVYRSSWRPRGVLLHLLLPLIIVIGRRNLRRSLGRLAALAREAA
jgi:uncharacterized protein YndB with AHSA1/START domain